MLSSFVQLSYVLKGVQRSTPGVRRVQLPITPDMLAAIQQKWAGEPAQFDRVMLWAAFCLAFFAFLRAGEFTCPSWERFDSSTMLSVGDVAVDSRDSPTYITVRIKKSKNDQLARGIVLYVGQSHQRVCAVLAVLSYLAVRPASLGPFFKDGGVLSRHRLGLELSAALQAIGCDSSLYKGHSFRIGAATAAARAGLNDSLIQTMGRWKSSAFMAYIRTPREQLVGVASRLAV